MTRAAPDVPLSRPRVLVAASREERARRWADLAHASGCDTLISDLASALDRARIDCPDAALVEPPAPKDLVTALMGGSDAFGPVPVTLMSAALLDPARDAPAPDITDPVQSLPNPFEADPSSKAPQDALERHVSRRLKAMLRLRAMVDEWTRRHAVLAALGTAPGDPARARDLIEGQDSTILVAGEPGPDYARIEALCAGGLTTVVGAFTPTMTVDYLSRHRFDVLILTTPARLEAYLPVVSAVRRNPRLAATPILMVTDASGGQDAAGAFRAGATDVLDRAMEDADFALRVSVYVTESTMRRVLKGVLDSPPPPDLRDVETGFAASTLCEAHLERMAAEAHATRRAWSLALLDLSDARGEDGALLATPDAVFAEAASLVGAMARAQDFRARLARRELAILMPETCRDDAHEVARRMSGALASARFETGARKDSLTVEARQTVVTPRLGLPVSEILREARQRLHSGHALARRVAGLTA